MGFHGEPSYEDYGLIERPVGDNGADIIPCIPHVQPKDNILKPLTLVLEMDHVGFCKHGAPAGYAGRCDATLAQGDEVSKYFVDMILGCVLPAFIQGRLASLSACWSMNEPVPDAQGPLVLKYSSSHPFES